MDNLLLNKSIEALCNGIQGLLSLFSLSLEFAANQKFKSEVIKKISKTLRNLVSLYSVELNFSQCLNIENYSELFYVLGEMKNIQEIKLWCPKYKMDKRER